MMEAPVECNISESGIPRSVPRVLIVDDDDAIRLLLCQSFEDSGFVVEEASNGPQALNLVRAFRPDLLLLDVVMPGMDGFETCRRIHELRGFEQLPILMMTALDDVDCINRAYDSGAVDVVSKPLNWVSLIHRIGKLIETARVTRRLYEVEADQQAVIDALGVLSFRLHRDGSICEVRVGNGFRKDLEPKHWEGKRIQEVIPLEMAQRFMRIVERTLSLGQAQTPLQGFSLGGPLADYEVNAILSGIDEVTIVVKPIEGPTGDSPAHRAAFFRALVDEAPDPIFVLNSAGRIEYQNPAATKVLSNGSNGRRHPENGRGLAFVHPEDAGVLFNGIVDTLETRGEGHRLEFRVQDRYGSWRMWDGRIVNQFEEPAIGGLLLACRDITELKERESELVRRKTKAEAMDQAKTEYLALVSHELRSPLNTIMGHTELMLEGMFGALTEQQLASMLRIRKNAREVLDLTFSILDLTRLEAGTLPVEYQEVSLPEVLREIRDDTEKTREASDVDLIWRVDEKLQTLHTDRAKIKMIVRNLINNAMKFTRAGSVTVDARLSDTGVEVCVTDTGVGIPEDKQQLIFEPFESVCGDTCGYESTGLGLYVVKRFLEVLGGDIQVESVPGEGTSFIVSLITKH